MTVRIIVAALALGTTTGCLKQVEVLRTLSSHTVKQGPNRSVDVVWIQQDKIYRCTNTDKGPVCQPARTEGK